MRSIQSRQLDLLDARSQAGWSSPGGRVPIDDQFPEDEANALAELESYNKHLFRPNTYLHKWWARRSGTTFRYILKGLVNDTSAGDFYEPGGLAGAIVLDPMMGGGTTIHEAIRMGASCLGVDIDPIPVLQARASLEYQSADSRKQAYTLFIRRLRESVSALFRTSCPRCQADAEIQFTLYAVRRRCHCREVGVLNSLVLRESRDGLTRICGICHDVCVDTHEACRVGSVHPHIQLLDRSQQTCPECGSAYEDILDVPYFQRYFPVVIFGNCPLHGAFWKRVDEKDLGLIRDADERFAHTALDPSEFSVPAGPKSKDLIARNVRSYLDLFSRRQLLFLEEAVRSVQTASEDHRLWLGLMLSTSLEFNSLLCGYKGAAARRPGAIRHVFSHHAYSFPYTALENNPVFALNTSGTLGRIFQDRVERAAKWAVAPVERRIGQRNMSLVSMRGEVDGGELVSSFEGLAGGSRRFLVIQADFRECTIPNSSVDYVVTDPPYYDSVQYGDLSMFFRVWLRQMLPSEADQTYDLSTAAVAASASEARAWGDALASIWIKCKNALREPHGRLIFTFHHWSPCAWSELTLSLKRSKLVLLNRYVVFSENPLSVHIRNLRALKHDCILVLAPAEFNLDTREWRLPSPSHSDDSRQFCLDCGSALGFFLTSRLSDDSIQQAWKDLLGVNGNGKSAGRSVRLPDIR